MRRLLTLLVVFLALGAALAALGILLAGRPSGAPVLAGDRVLTLDIAEPLADYEPEVRLPFLEHRGALHLERIWRSLAAARNDGDVVALAVRIDDAPFGLAKAQEIRRQIASFADSGKRVACYLDTAGEGSNGTLDYYLASACPEISLSPAGELNVVGLFADPLFLRGSLDKLKIEPDFLAAGRYKSAAESYTEKAHSPAAREALDALLDSYFGQIVSGIATARSLPDGAVRALIDGAPHDADAALTAHLVDRVEYPDEFRARLDEELGQPDEWEALDDYASRRGERRRGGEEIALVFAEGTIVRGGDSSDPWSGERYLGSDSLGNLLADLEEDDDVRAVVLRIDSPGGSALASDLLLRRVELLARAKPVVVSMSDLAASGGYYIAARATRIVAEPGTLTGSIGVIMGKLATQRFEEELLGATRDPLARGARAGLYSSARPFAPDDRELLRRRIDATYARFLTHVAEGRSLPLPSVERVAQGRIWSGEDALRQGLVDELGGLDAAIAAARRLAGLGERQATVHTYPRSRSLWEVLTERRPPPFAAELARFAEIVRPARVPGLLELPPELRRLARPF